MPPTLQEIRVPSAKHLSRIKQKPLAFPSLKKPPQIVDMAANGNLIFQDTNKATFVGANSNVVIDTVNASFGVGVDVNGPTSNLHVVGNAYVSSNLEVGTANLFVDTVNSRVGVGTTEPTDLLDVHYPNPSYGSLAGTEEGSLTVSAGAEHSNAVVYFRTPFDAAAPAKRAIFSDGGTYSGGASGGLHFCLESTNNNTTKVDLTDSKMTILHNGNVGIGTTSPGAPLTIKASKGNINASDMASLRSNAAVRVNAFSSSADTLLMGHLSTDTAGDSGDNPRFYIQNVWDNSTTGREILINPAGGNVGIGTNAPNAKLQVDYTEGTLSDMNYSTTSSWHDKGLGIKGGQGGFLYGLDINHSIFLRRSPFGATDHNAYCNVGYHAFYTGGMIENQTEKMRIHANGNVDILTGDLNVVGSYKSDGKTVQRTLIGYQKYTSSTSVSYGSGTTGYQNPWSVSYTRIHSGSEIYIIGDLCLAQAMGATGTTSYRGIYGRLKVYSGTTNYYSDSTYDWQRIDNSFHEYQRQSRVHFDKHALPETTAGQTITIYAQVEEGGKSGTTNAFGINIWAGRSFIEVFEVM